MKITEQTTLAELAVERARLGIEEMSIHINAKGARTCAVFGQGRGCQRAGATEAEAIDAALRAFELAAAGSEGAARFERIVHMNVVDHDAMTQPIEKCNVPMCGESGVCAKCRARGAR